MKRSAIGNALASAGAEFLFVLLPLIVITLVFIFKGEHFAQITASPEWSISAAILGGQTLVRFVSGLARATRPSWQRVSFAVAVRSDSRSGPRHSGDDHHRGGQGAAVVSYGTVRRFLRMYGCIFCLRHPGHLWVDEYAAESDRTEST